MLKFCCYLLFLLSAISSNTIDSMKNLNQIPDNLLIVLYSEESIIDRKDITYYVHEDIELTIEIRFINNSLVQFSDIDFSFEGSLVSLMKSQSVKQSFKKDTLTLRFLIENREPCNIVIKGINNNSEKFKNMLDYSVFINFEDKSKEINS